MRTLHLKYRVTLIFVTIMSVLAGQNKKIDSLRIVLKNAHSDTAIGQATNALAWEMARVNPDSAFLLTNAALRIFLQLDENGSAAEKRARTAGIAKSHQYLGWFNFKKGIYDVAVAENNEALSLWTSIDDKKGIATVLGNQGIVYHNQGNFPKALDNFLSALKMNEALGNKEGIARDLGNLGLAYENRGEHMKALDHLGRALKLREELGNKNALAVVLGNIGIIYQKIDPYKALEYFYRSLSIANEQGDVAQIALNYENIGALYLVLGVNEIKQGNSAYADTAYFSKALSYLNKALVLHQKLGDRRRQSSTLTNMGEVYMRMKDYKLSEEILLRSLGIADSISALENRADALSNLSELYSIIGRAGEALKVYKEYVGIRDSLFNIQRNEEMTKLELNKQFEIKEERLKAEQERRNAVAAERSRKQQVVIYIIGFGFFVTLVMVFITLRANRQKQRANSLLAEKNKVIANQKQLVEQKQKEVLDSIQYAKRIQDSLLPSDRYLSKNMERLRKKD